MILVSSLWNQIVVDKLTHCIFGWDIERGIDKPKNLSLNDIKSEKKTAIFLTIQLTASHTAYIRILYMIPWIIIHMIWCSKRYVICFSKWAESERFNKWFDERSDKRRLSEWFDEWLGEWFNAWLDQRFNEWFNAWFDEQFYKQFNAWFDEWFDERFNIWFHGQFNERFDEWLNVWFKKYYLPLQRRVQ